MQMISYVIRKIFPRSYLTNRHSIIGRYILGAVAACTALAITREYVLFREIFRCMREDRYLTAFSRLAWYMERGWPQIKRPSDPLHLFCSHMDRGELAVMRRFLLRQASHTSKEVFLGELAFISACDAILACGEADQGEALGTSLKDADALLQLILNTPSTMSAAIEASTDNKEDRSLHSGFDPNSATQALCDAVQLLEEHGFEPFIISGTLLGAVREGAILKHDYDIDLGLFVDEIDLEQLTHIIENTQIFRSLGLYKQSTMMRDDFGSMTCHNRPVLFKLRHANGIMTDIFLHWVAGDQVWHGTTLYLWGNSIFTLERRDLAGISLLSPVEFSTQLAENYGDWRTPQIAYHCALDTPNLVLHSSPLALAVAVRRLALLRERGDDTGALLEQMSRAGFVRRTDAVKVSSGWQVVADFLEGVDCSGRPFKQCSNTATI